MAENKFTADDYGKLIWFGIGAVIVFFVFKDIILKQEDQRK